jgi:hypothetical protein
MYPHNYMRTITIPTTVKIAHGVEMINIRIPLYVDDQNKGMAKDWSMLDKIKGILADRNNIDPLQCQKQVRDEWS